MTADGTEIQEEYAAIGRSVRPGRGILHMKVLAVGPYAIIGSTNWTTSSKCNHEMSSVLKLTEDGSMELDRRIAALKEQSERFDAGGGSTNRSRVEVLQGAAQARSASDAMPTVQFGNIVYHPSLGECIDYDAYQ